mmetsp:Transcript_22672/g.51829  ORF Transcript_22672/g.51829 Transcript_22672/m.51829 type:complete len:193 (+) Transcript_22672:38-616(+)
MPSEGVTFASLAKEAQLLVTAAGEALVKTTYPFAGSAESNCGATALEQTFCKQRAPQRTIAAALSGEVCSINDEVVSSVGALWRDGWRCERDSAQHCIRFIREVPQCSLAASGEIAGLRSFVDFAFVLGQWFVQRQSSAAEGPMGGLKRPSVQSKAKRLREGADDVCWLAQMAPPRKLSRFFKQVASCRDHP